MSHSTLLSLIFTPPNIAWTQYNIFLKLPLTWSLKHQIFAGNFSVNAYLVRSFWIMLVFYLSALGLAWVGFGLQGVHVMWRFTFIWCRFGNCLLSLHFIDMAHIAHCFDMYVRAQHTIILEWSFSPHKLFLHFLWTCLLYIHVGECVFVDACVCLCVCVCEWVTHTQTHTHTHTHTF